MTTSTTPIGLSLRYGGRPAAPVTPARTVDEMMTLVRRVSAEQSCETVRTAARHLGAWAPPPDIDRRWAARVVRERVDAWLEKRVAARPDATERARAGWEQNRCDAIARAELLFEEPVYELALYDASIGLYHTSDQVGARCCRVWSSMSDAQASDVWRLATHAHEWAQQLAGIGGGVVAMIEDAVAARRASEVAARRAGLTLVRGGA